MHAQKTAGSDVALFVCHWHIYEILFVSSEESHGKWFLISKKINTIHALRTCPLAANLLLSNGFLIFQGIVATFYR